MLKSLFCHHIWLFSRRIGGDMINQVPDREIVVCDKCGKESYRQGKKLMRRIELVIAGGHSHVKYEEVNDV